MCVRYTPTETSLADIMTKILSTPAFESLRQMCRGIKLGDYHVGEKAERARAMYVSDLHIWMTISVYCEFVMQQSSF